MRREYFPEGWQVSIDEFLALFYRYGYIYKPLVGGSWFSANEKWALSDTEILKAIACAHKKFLLGCRSDKATRFAVLDIDAKSKYHKVSELGKITGALAEAGITKTVLYRSSYSEGWHLYIFFDEPIGAKDLRRQIINLLTHKGFEIANGRLEVFPNSGEGSMGMGLRLPLQSGFAWLDNKTGEVIRERYELNATRALECFIDDLNADANTYKDFRKLKDYVGKLETRKKEIADRYTGSQETGNVVAFRKTKEEGTGDFVSFVRGVFGALPPGILPDNWYRGRLYHLNGLTGESQRADATLCIGHYFFYGDPSRDLPALGYGYEQEREYALKEFFRLRHNGQSDDINAGRADAVAQIERAANWTPPTRRNADKLKYAPEVPIAWVRNNAKRKTDARKRIAAAMEDIKKLGRSFTTVELQEKASCSRETLYKHADLWRKDYEDLAEGFFAFCTDEYNAVEGVVPAENLPPPSEQIKITPPGLLAARRVAYEISMRSKRDSLRQQREAEKFSVARERSWRTSVDSLCKGPPEDLSVQQIKERLVVLAGYLPVAPCEEDATVLSGYLFALRQHHNRLLSGPRPIKVAPAEIAPATKPTSYQPITRHRLSERRNVAEVIQERF